MSKLAALKKNRGNNLKKLQEKLEQQSGGGAPRDERIWKPTFNKDKGKGTAIVRFLTAKEGDPFVHVQSYQFSGPGGNYWDLARQTIGEKDPIQLAAISAFRKAKNDGDESLKTYAKRFIPNSTYYANVLVIRDEEKPENEGKVMIYQFGRQIFNIIEKVIKPEFDDVDPMDPFDFWEGADFKIRMVSREIPDRRTGNKIIVPNYENSEFDKPSELFGGDETAIDEVYQKTYDLSDFIAPEKFKSFEEVAEQFKKVTGKPYNWLSEEGVEEHLADQESKAELDNSTDEGDTGDNHRPKEEEDPAENQDADSGNSDDDAPSGETPLERFKRLAKKK